MNVVKCKGLSKNYRRVNALKDISFSIEANKITGLIGRNGAGKTTLLKMLVGYYQKTEGELLVFSQDPFNSLEVSKKTIFIDDQMSFPAALTLSQILTAASNFYKNWNKHIANGLFTYFNLHPDQRHYNLSKGMKSTFNMIIGLASRCELTILDEPTTGMDAAVRKDFYRALLKDYIEYPRTIILSSHLLNELEDVLEDVLLIHDGKVRLHSSVEDLKEYAIGLRGKEEALEMINEEDILYKKDVGGFLYIVVKNTLTKPIHQQLKQAGVVVTPVATDDLCVYLTSKNKGGIDDVFQQL